MVVAFRAAAGSPGRGTEPGSKAEPSSKTETVGPPPAPLFMIFRQLMGRIIELRQGSKQHPESLAQVFIPCPVCGKAIELARDPEDPETIACPACGARFER
ncbi:MAG TPA: hypothetical protein VJ986_00970 [Gaiellaceae bacterium]|nr:hypothetical protein [Gaiellaceae bacterium]